MNSHFHLLGTLAEPLNLQASAKGTHWGNLLVTVDRRYKDRDGAWKEESDTITMPVFGKRAEWLAKTIKKGEFIFITGRIGGESREHGSKVYHDIVLWIDDVKPMVPSEAKSEAWRASEPPPSPAMATVNHYAEAISNHPNSPRI